MKIPARDTRHLSHKNYAAGGTLRYYDAPVDREGVPGVAVIVFAFIENMAAIRAFSPQAFTEAVLEVC